MGGESYTRPGDSKAWQEHGNSKLRTETEIRGVVCFSIENTPITKQRCMLFGVGGTPSGKTSQLAIKQLERQSPVMWAPCSIAFTTFHDLTNHSAESSDTMR